MTMTTDQDHNNNSNEEAEGRREPLAERNGNNNNNQRGRNGKQGRNKGGKVSAQVFKGGVPDMEGKVFQVHSEQKQKGQFEETLRALELYASKHHKADVEALVPLFKNLKEPTVPTPKGVSKLAGLKDSTKKLTPWEDVVVKERAKQWIADEKRLRSTVISLYNVTWSQCSRLMRNRLRSQKDFEKVEDDTDVTELLKLIKIVSHEFEAHISPYDAISEAKRKMYTFKQAEGESNEAFLQQFKTLVDVLNHYGDEPMVDKSLITIEKQQDLAAGKALEDEKVYKDRVLNKTLALEYLKGCKHSEVLEEIRKLFVKNINTFPNNLTEAYNQVDHYTNSLRASKNPWKPSNKRGGKGKQNDRRSQERAGTGDTTVVPGVQHSQVGIVAGTDGKVKEGITCYNCNKEGHYSDKCPFANEGTEEQHYQDAAEIEGDDESTESLVVSFQYAQVERARKYGKEAILLDTGSTCSVFNNRKMLLNVRRTSQTLRAYTNGGHQDSNMKGEVPGLIEVWFNPNSMINILSWSDVRKKYRITADTNEGAFITVHTPGKGLKFEEVESGLYLLDFKTKPNVSAYSFLTLVEANLQDFTAGEVERARTAKTFYKNSGMKGYSKFVKLVNSGYYRNCDITGEDVKRALHIWGPEVGVLKGKTTRKQKEKVNKIAVTPIPDEILSAHNTINLNVDFMFVQGLMVLHTLSSDYQFRTAKVFMSKKKANKDDMLKGVREAINMYEKRGITVTQVSSDNEFECIREDLRPTLLHTVGAGDHVGTIERANRTCKEGTRSHIHNLPYKKYPKAMVAGCILYVTRRTNDIPSDVGVSDSLSPNTLITGIPAPDFKQMMEITYGDYVEVHEDRQVKNTQEARTTGAIALYPSETQGKSWYLMSLDTGMIIHKSQWTHLPITQQIIDRVTEIAEKEDQPNISTNFTYEWTSRRLPDNDDVQGAEEPTLADTTLPHNDNSAQDEQHEYMEETEEAPTNNETTLDDDEGAHSDEDEGAPNDNDEGAFSDDDEGAPSEDTETTTEEEGVQEDTTIEESEVNDDNSTVAEEKNNEIDNEPTTEPTAHMTTRTGRSVVRHNYKQLNKIGTTGTQLMQQDTKRRRVKPNKQKVRNMFTKVVGIIMAHMENEKAGNEFDQMSMKAGIKRFGKKAVQAVLAEYMQLEDMDTMEAIDPSKLTRQQRRDALELLTFIKMKRSGKLKSRACANGKKQRRYIKKENVTSPTIQLESLILSMVIDAFEGRDVATADVVGAYLKTHMKEEVHIKLVGEAAEIMCDVNAKYKDNIVMEKGKKTLYMRLNKALYGCMQSALLWYETYANCLKEMGFRLNVYDPCVANKMIEGKQCTVCWYVDDSKISHENPKVVSEVIKKIENKFGKMTVCRGKEHTFVGMDFVMKEDGNVGITMRDYLTECMESYGNITKNAATPAKHNLFDVDKESKELDEERADLFHHIAAKLLFVSKRARLDIDLAVSFLCTRVGCSTEQDWEKLGRVLQYIRGTIDLERIVGSKDVKTIQTWADASYATHPDMKGHTGGVISLGRGAVHHKSSKQRLNTKSSTETEVVGASDYLPWTIWTKKFLEEQGYKTTRSVFYQDNESAIKLESNGRRSCGDKSRHIDIRYFFIKDVIKRENIDIKHCPTEIMVADFFTKPLQGAAFRRLRDIIMGHKPPPTEERVEKGDNPGPGDSAPGTSKTVGGDSSCNKVQPSYLDALMTNTGRIGSKSNDRAGRINQGQGAIRWGNDRIAH